MFNVLPWRILYIVDELESRYQVAAGWDETEINSNWEFLEKDTFATFYIIHLVNVYCNVHPVCLF